MFKMYCWAVRLFFLQETDFSTNFDVLLSITLANNQLDAQFLYFIISLLQSSTCFKQRRAHHEEVKLY